MKIIRPEDEPYEPYSSKDGKSGCIIVRDKDLTLKQAKQVIKQLRAKLNKLERNAMRVAEFLERQLL